MGTRRSLSPNRGKIRLASTTLMLVLATSVAVACSQTVPGRAHLPGGSSGWDGSPNIKNIGVSTDPSAEPTTKNRSPSAPRSSSYPTNGTSSPDADSSGGDLTAYVQSKGLSHQPVDAGDGLTATVQKLPGWTEGGSKKPGTQVSIQHLSPRAVMIVEVARFSGSFDLPGLLAAARVSVVEDGDAKVKDDTDYQGYPSTAGVVLTSSKDGTRLAEILRYIVVQDPSSSGFYLVSSAIAVAADDWNSLKSDLVRLDSSISVSGS